MALFDMNGGGTDQQAAPSAGPQDDLSGGLALPWKAALPYIAMQSLAAGAAGMSPNPVLLPDIQRQAFGNLLRVQQQQQALSANQGLVRAQDAFSRGQFDEAMQHLSSSPAALLSPAGLNMRGQIANAKYSMGVRQIEAAPFLDPKSPYYDPFYGNQVMAGGMHASDAVKDMMSRYNSFSENGGRFREDKLTGAVQQLVGRTWTLSPSQRVVQEQMPGTGGANASGGGAPHTSVIASGGLEFPSELRTHASASDQMDFQNASASGDTAKMDSILGRATQAYFAEKAPEGLKESAQELGMSPAQIAALQSGSGNQRDALRIMNHMNWKEAQKKAQDMMTAENIKMTIFPAATIPALSKYSMYLRTEPDGTFSEISNMTPAGDIVRGGQIKNGMPGHIEALDAKSADAYKLISRLTPQLKSMENAANVLYQGTKPGETWGNAVSLKYQGATGGPVVANRDMLNMEVSAELARMIQSGGGGISRLVTAYQKEGKVKFLDTDSHESTLVKTEILRGLKRNYQETMAGTPEDKLTPIEPYKTNPVLREMRAGRRPVFDQDGNFLGARPTAAQPSKLGGVVPPLPGGQ